MNRHTSRASDTSVFPRWVTGVKLADSSASAGDSPTPIEFYSAVRGRETWKRGFDVFLGLGGLFLCAPLMVLVAALIKVTSRGPVLVKQERIGVNRRVGARRNGNHARPLVERRRTTDRRNGSKHGKPFSMYKFRSMKNNAENGEPVWTADNDPRVTALGRILRKTRMDETPQFWNVVRGDMSFVGPRPERDYFYDKIGNEVPQFQLRLRAKPGITGLAQVNLGYCNTVPGMREKLGHDLEYIRNMSPSTDAKILLRTVSVVLTGKGAC